jgi:hypothetical protein
MVKVKISQSLPELADSEDLIVSYGELGTIAGTKTKKL